MLKPSDLLVFCMAKRKTLKKHVKYVSAVDAFENRRDRLRAGFELASDRLGALEPGEVITALETRVNGDGILRVRCSFGWLSERAADGTALLAEVPDGESSTGSESEESGTESKESAEDKAF